MICKDATAFIDALDNDSEEDLRKALDAGIDPNTGVGEFWESNALHIVKSAALAKLLIEAGTDVNFHDTDGRTPLHNAPTAEIARLLLDAGADVDALDCSLETPLHMSQLTDQEALTNDRDAMLDYQGSNSGVQKMLVLLNAGAQVAKEDPEGNTALHNCSTYRTDGKAWITLVEAGADPFQANNAGADAFEIADGMSEWVEDGWNKGELRAVYDTWCAERDAKQLHTHTDDVANDWQPMAVPSPNARLQSNTSAQGVDETQEQPRPAQARRL